MYGTTAREPWGSFRPELKRPPDTTRITMMQGPPQFESFGRDHRLNGAYFKDFVNLINHSGSIASEVLLFVAWARIW